MLSQHASVATAVFAALNMISSVQGQGSYGQSYTSVGCFSANVGDIVYHNLSMTYNSYMICSQYCIADNAPYMALNYRSCYCGNQKPTSTAEVAASQCAQECPGYTPNACGSTGSPTLWSVLLTGAKGSGSSSSSSSASSSAASSAASSKTSVDPTIIQHTSYVISNVVQTVIGSATATSTSQSPSSGGGPSKAGIAAGVVVGIVVLGAIIGAVYFILRQRRRKAVEKEHRRQSSMHAFTNSQKAPHMSVFPSNDSRLDPIIAARRQSDGSIADNIDFSRRVLKVTNPDDRW